MLEFTWTRRENLELWDQVSSQRLLRPVLSWQVTGFHQRRALEVIQRIYPRLELFGRVGIRSARLPKKTLRSLRSLKMVFVEPIWIVLDVFMYMICSHICWFPQGFTTSLCLDKRFGQMNSPNVQLCWGTELWHPELFDIIPTFSASLPFFVGSKLAQSLCKRLLHESSWYLFNLSKDLKSGLSTMICFDFWKRKLEPGALISPALHCYQAAMRILMTSTWPGRESSVRKAGNST